MSQDRPTVLPLGESILSTMRENGGTTQNAFRRVVFLRACADGRGIAATATQRLATPDRTHIVPACFMSEGSACTPVRADGCSYNRQRKRTTCEFPRVRPAYPRQGPFSEPPALRVSAGAGLLELGRPSMARLAARHEGRPRCVRPTSAFHLFHRRAPTSR